MNDLDNIQTQIAKKITMKVDNQIEDFIAREVKSYGFDTDEEIIINAKKICEAIEKQIRKRVYLVSDGYADGYPVWEEYCPACDSELDGCSDYDFCPYCGQALDWSEEDDA